MKQDTKKQAYKIPKVKGLTRGKWATEARKRVDAVMLAAGLCPVTAQPLKGEGK